MGILTKEEVRQLLVLLRELYPQSFVHHTAEGSQMIFQVWFETFKDENAKLVHAAVMKLIQNNKTAFAPTIGEIREAMYDLAGIRIMTADEVWNTARKFWCNLGTRSAAEIEPRYKKLPEEVKRAFTISDMIQYADMNTTDVLQYEKPRFMKEYKNIEAQHKAKMLSGSVTGNALTFNGKLMIGEDKEEDNAEN
jgi:hypothetical protein